MRWARSANDEFGDRTTGAEGRSARLGVVCKVVRDTLERIAVAQVRRVAELAKAAQYARGLHDPAAAFDLDPLPLDDPTRLALHGAIMALPRDAQDELRALVLIGRGDFGAKEWARAVTQASRAPDAPLDFLTGQANLHEDLEKGLYEIKLA